MDEHRPAKALVVCNEPAQRIAGAVRITPWKDFLQALWSGEVVS